MYVTQNYSQLDRNWMNLHCNLAVWSWVEKWYTLTDAWRMCEVTRQESRKWNNYCAFWNVIVVMRVRLNWIHFIFTIFKKYVIIFLTKGIKRYSRYYPIEAINISKECCVDSVNSYWFHHGRRWRWWGGLLISSNGKIIW